MRGAQTGVRLLGVDRALAGRPHASRRTADSREMQIIKSAIDAIERRHIPDVITRLGVACLVGRTGWTLSRLRVDPNPAFARDMERFPVAEHTAAANDQHYELPPDFFAASLGPRLKYSCCYYDRGDESLADAELRALEETILHADVRDGQTILELGCGWGSLTLFMAERFPNARITAVSNSASQRAHIESEARRRALPNVIVVTADMNAFEADQAYDRILSVEMFEHISNWRALLARTRGWLTRDGRMFIHVFSHKTAPYRFDHRDAADWIAQHFFTGGLMPSHDLIRQFDDLFEVEGEWRWNGRHYERTALHWLEIFDANASRIDPVLSAVYGEQASLWRRRWRLFYLATAGLFGHRGGSEWGVSHYLLRPGRPLPTSVRPEPDHQSSSVFIVAAAS